MEQKAKAVKDHRVLKDEDYSFFKLEGADFFKSDGFWRWCHMLALDDKDIATRSRAGIAKALLVTAENRDWWRKQYYELKKQSGAINDPWKQSTEPNCETPNVVIFSDPQK
jgi:hypothetical protein